jgi:hypothetical protein
MEMELRHLRYFVAVAETESLTLAAKSKLHTSQPSLSRQLRDLEEEIGAQLMRRRALIFENWAIVARQFRPLRHAFRKLGSDIGSTQDEAVEPQENIFRAECY